MILNRKINMKHFNTVEYEDDCLTKILILNRKIHLISDFQNTVKTIINTH